jgi:uncharacterized protein YciI
MHVIKLTYIVPTADVDRHIVEHRQFLDKGYEKGIFIASGPLTPRTGGIILAANVETERLKAFMKQDPFAVHNIALYEFYEFNPIKFCAQIKDLLS